MAGAGVAVGEGVAVGTDVGVALGDGDGVARIEGDGRGVRLGSGAAHAARPAAEAAAPIWSRRRREIGIAGGWPCMPPIIGP